MDTAEVVWGLVLTGGMGMLGFMVKAKFNDVDRLSTLLNKTREEIARDTVTRAELSSNIDKVCDRMETAFDRLEAKIEKILDKKGG